MKPRRTKALMYIDAIAATSQCQNVCVMNNL